MESKKANELTDKIIALIEADDFEIRSLIPLLTELRECAKEEEDPMVTRILRHMYEHIEENGSFEFTAKTDEDDEGELFLLESEDDAENLLYIMELIRANRNETNRQELYLMGEELKAARS
jgi:hypothetical protein